MRKRQMKKLLKSKLKTIDLSNPCLLVVDYEGISIENLERLSIMANSLSPNKTLIVSKDIAINSLSEKKMNDHGWFKKLNNN